MDREPVNLVVVLGPTAAGKTGLGVQLARRFGGEIISADSRQVYRGLDLGTGKDLDDYTSGGDPVAYHLIDIVDLDAQPEFSVYQFQQHFHRALRTVIDRGALPIVVGGSGLYLSAVLEDYQLVEAPPDPALRAELSQLSQPALVERLLQLVDRPHNTSDLEDRARLMRAIEIATRAVERAPEPAGEGRPAFSPLILGVRWERAVLRRRIRERLRQRLDHGLVQEVEALLQAGISREKLRWLGLEYRFVAEFLRGQIKSRNDLEQKLASAINAFAKRQETWFRRMERRGARIHWLDGPDLQLATRLVGAALGDGVA